MTTLLDDLNPQQKEAVKEIKRPVLVLAGAGAGKTRVITYKIAYLITEGFDPKNILGLTFTKKAANEMKERVATLLGKPYGSLPLFLGTFHAFGASILRRYARYVGLEPTFTIYDEQDQLNLIKTLIKTVDMGVSVQPSVVAHYIKRAKLSLMSPDDFLKQSQQDRFDEFIYEIYKRYQRRLLSLNAVDFADLLTKTLELLKSHEPVRETLSNRYKYILVDEYQDTNPPQYEIIYLLAKDHRNICVVGDEDQSIYSFRGATVENIAKFCRDFPEHRLVKLERNYRSTQIILDAANEVISKNPNRIPKKLWTDRDENIPIKLVATSDATLQALYIIKEITSKFKDRLNEVAVLYRMNYESRIIEEAFLKYGIPYRLIGGVRFYERMEIKDMLAYLKFIANPKDEVSLLRIINVPTRGIGPKALEKLRELAKKVRLDFAPFVYAASLLAIDEKEAQRFLGDSLFKRLKDVSSQLERFSNLFEDLATLIVVSQAQDSTPSQLIQTILSDLRYNRWLEKISSDDEEVQSRKQNVYELINLAKHKPYKGLSGLNQFLEEIALIEEASELEEESKVSKKVTLMTMHSAKGLEFETVFIVDAVEGVIPHQKSVESPLQLQEERRLFYVAITRTKRYLYILYPQKMTYLGNIVETIPSRFLNDIPAHLVEYEVYG